MLTLRRYLETLTAPQVRLRTLGCIDLGFDRQRRLHYYVGNSSVTFRATLGGQAVALRCYLRRQDRKRMRAIYGPAFHEEELYLYNRSLPGEWVDIVVQEWIEGRTLREEIHKAAMSGDRDTLSSLSASFDRLAAGLVSDDRAHGDLKPENIIVDEGLNLHLIDFDASFLPEFAGQHSMELGTSAYQHPLRKPRDFDERLDDYPAALISTALAAMAHDPGIYTDRATADGLLFTPGTIADDPLYRHILDDFAARGDAAHYRIARQLTLPSLRLCHIAELFAHIVAPKAADPAHKPDSEPEMYYSHGLFGYRCGDDNLIPPLYDDCFDFSEGLAAVKLASSWHYIDCTGRAVMSFPGCLGIKPIRNGKAVIIRENDRIILSREGGGIFSETKPVTGCDLYWEKYQNNFLIDYKCLYLQSIRGIIRNVRTEKFNAVGDCGTGTPGMFGRGLAAHPRGRLVPRRTTGAVPS